VVTAKESTAAGETPVLYWMCYLFLQECTCNEA
jgi:hypothetical protein